ncbi:MAG TPA: SMC-Scp complex subunit ScpB [Opitutaceae bacterium]|nr:SMC-Scp complex subunit ScpB [Opitutaceae bacterium]
MAFNLKKVLKALLFSSSQPLSINEIQETFTRFHEQDPLPGGLPPGEAKPDQGAEPTAAPPEAPPAELPAEFLLDSPVDEELYRDVPSLVTAAQIREALEEIALELRAANDIFLLSETAQGYRLVTLPRLARWVRALRNEPPPVKLSQSALETLAVTAYRQPVTRAEIEHIRGVSAETGINRLLERELIYIIGRADLPGRPIQYGTTETFLEFVGARSLDELPASDVLSRRQIDQWLQMEMGGSHPSDREMGLAEEGAEQLTLDDAARAASATPAPTPRPEAPEVVEGSAPPGVPEPPVAAAAAAAQISST